MRPWFAFGWLSLTAGCGSAGAPATSPSGARFDEVVPQLLTPYDALFSTLYGFSAAGVGDVDGDGYADVAVGAMLHDEAGPSAGAVYLYLGTPTGIDPDTDQLILPPDPAEDLYFGTHIAGLGDLDTDGYADFAVAVRYADISGGVYILPGSPGGPDVAGAVLLSPSDPAPESWYASDVNAAGDLDGDGSADLAVGCFHDSTLAESAGAVYLYSGTPAGVDPASERKLYSGAPEEFGLFGRAVVGPGDIDGDGYDDLVVGAYLEGGPGEYGAIYVHRGGAGGVAEVADQRLTASDGPVEGYFGFTLDGADLDLDGHADIAVGAWAYYDDEQGAVYVYYGGPGGLEVKRETRLTPDDGDSDDFGRSLAVLGDFNGSGWPDLAVGAVGDDSAGVDAGSVYFFWGAAGGLDVARQWEMPPPDPFTNDLFGNEVYATGDVDADGYDDALIVSPQFGLGAYVFLGACDEGTS
jgi:hypothetical protein